ncbi:hypothetical protein ACIQ6V_25740 [Streptomyces sp. NPDC096198]|uniref:hypothetical protein n=1 Tax=Streptomyces sp. NPDC096198 TaxID=3366080 RepID=UPI00380CD700
MSFTDAAEPVDRLKAPGQPDEFSKGVVGDSMSTVSDFLSPSEWALQTIEFVFGSNPLEEAISWFTGDWESYVKCGEMWASTGKFVSDVAENLRSGNRQLDATWNGNAADSAYVYFDELARKIGSLESDLKELQGAYKEVGLAVARTADLVKGLLEQLADEAIIAEVELAAGTLLAETGVGAVMGYAAAALEIAEMIKTWGRATEAYSAAQNTVDAATAAAGAVAGRISVALQNFPEPGQSYDNPAV